MKGSGLGLVCAFGAEVLGQALGGTGLGVSQVVGNFAETLGSLRLVPVLLLAVYCMRAALLPAATAVWVIGVASPILACLAYLAEHSSRMALSQRRWTVASLSAGVAWVAGVVAVIVLGELTLLVMARRRPHKASSKVVRDANGNARG